MKQHVLFNNVKYDTFCLQYFSLPTLCRNLKRQEGSKTWELANCFKYVILMLYALIKCKVLTFVFFWAFMCGTNIPYHKDFHVGYLGYN